MSPLVSIKTFLRAYLSKKSLLVILALLGLFVAIVAYLYTRQINLALKDQAAKNIAATKIESTVKLLAPIKSTSIKLFVEALGARAMCEYNGAYYVATAGGLLALDKEGKLLNHYTILDGLPSLNLLCLSVFRSQLYIGTAESGLIVFNGKDFAQYQIEKPLVKQINVLLPREENLLVGSFDGGLLSFDGTKFTRRDQDIKPIPQITFLLEHENRLYVGTYNSGLYIWQESRWQQLTKEQGLPSNRITSLIADKRGIIAATDFGVVLRNANGELEQISTKANIISLAYFQENLFAGLLTGGVIDLSNKAATSNNLSVKEITVNETFALKEEKKKTNVILWTSNDNLIFALTSKGVLRQKANKTDLEFEPFEQTSSLALLRAPHISSIAFDERGRLWIGYFDQGIDIFESLSMELITHLEDENIREINFISQDRESLKMLAATSAGLAIFDSELQYKLLSERDGLNSSSVAHMSIIPSSSLNEMELAIATGKGLTFLKGNVFRSPISLPNNYLYTTAFTNNHLFIGSLGGLIEMEGLRVVRSFTIANSKLSHNWINALVAVNGTLYIGTNGGGVDALTSSGELINFFPEIGKFDVNPNAIYADNEYLYVGTLDQGVFLLNLKTKIWRKYTQTLPSTNVTSIISDKEHVYFATTNGIVRVERKLVLGN